METKTTVMFDCFPQNSYIEIKIISHSILKHYTYKCFAQAKQD